MKNSLRVAVAGIAFFSLTACADTNDTVETTTDSLTTTSTTIDGTEGMSNTTTTVTPGRYIHLGTGKEVEIDRDASTGYWVDVSTRTPVEYYISTDTRDTFDMQGRLVNYALDRTNDGRYMVNEERLKVKMDTDGDMKAKTADGDKIKYDASSDQLKMKSADGSKEKLSDDKYKSKTDTSKIKVKQ